MQIILAILALSLLIIIHEFGHFIVAKLSGIKVDEFSLFMGPKLFSVKRGETVYSVRLVPLGGYVKMEGEEQASDDARAFNKKPIPVRMAVIIAGPLMNLLAAILMVIILFSINGFSTTKISGVAPDSPAHIAGIQKGDRIVSYNGNKVYHPFDFLLFSYVAKNKPVKMEVQRDSKIIKAEVTPLTIPAENSYKLGFSPKESEGPESNIVAGVSAGSPGQKAGLKVNDRIILLNDTVISSRQDVGRFLKENTDKPVNITVLRDGKKVVLKNVIPMLQKTPEMHTVGVEGFQPARGDIGEVIKQSFVYTYSTARNVYYSLAFLLQRKVGFNEVMGPIGIVSTIGDVVQQSPTVMDKFLGLLSITSLISINLGVFNLIPFPALDGSKIIILAIEAVRRKSIPPEKEAMISMVGLVLLIMLMIFATSNDVMRWFRAG